MILDAQNSFSLGQVLPLPVASNPASDSVDTFIALGFNPNTLKDLGAGEGLWLTVVNPTAITGAAGALLRAELVTDDNATSATPSILASPTLIQAGADISAVSIPAGTILAQFRIPNNVNYERFLGVRYVTTVAALLGGTVSAFLTKDVQAWRAYAKNYVIS
jgi:hypothetical protein